MLTPVIPAERWSDPKNHRNGECLWSILFICSSSIYWASTMFQAVCPCWDAVVNKWEVVHVFMEFIPQQQRSKPLSYQNLWQFEVLTEKIWPSRPRMLLIGKTSFSCLPLPQTSFPPQVPPAYTFCSTRPSLIAGLGLLNNESGFL